jgi:hypothetical protein
VIWPCELIAETVRADLQRNEGERKAGERQRLRKGGNGKNRREMEEKGERKK